MKEKCSARFHLTVNQLKVFQRFIYPVHVRSSLITALVMIDATHQMRTLEHLQTTILPSGAVDSNQTAAHIGKQAIVRVPVTVVLVPFPGASYKGFLEHHLVVIVIDLSSQKLLERFDDTQTTHERTIDVVFERIG